MTKEEWIEHDHSFYHLTQQSNVQKILAEGLRKGDQNPFGICVIRTLHSDILEYLCQMMLFTTNKLEFAIIEIIPSQHALLASEIGSDQVVEVTNPLHNYIRRNNLYIREANVVDVHVMRPNSIIDFKVYEQRLQNSGLIESLNDETDIKTDK